ncbi:MAG TPA: helix-turn-helix domain-containing protein, partial [Phnomibacter sp.]|nr:helix-turn-helix domain-containing protein [Phnomibacter sp.]
EFKARIEDDFPENIYPVDKILRLKLGAQVMFIKNDMESPRRFFNGKIGVVTDIDTDKIVVHCKGDDAPIDVPVEIWRNIRYTYESQSRTVTEEELGKFSQFPLRLAWAITIHKSQGLTFEKAIINAGQAFEAGQVYVALSRCTSLDGMVLLSPVHRGLVMTHERIAQFGRKERNMEDLLRTAEAAKRIYLQDQLRKAFNFSEVQMKVVQMQQVFSGLSDMFNRNTGEWLHTLQDLVNELVTSSQPLLPSLQQVLQQAQDLEKDASLQQFLKENVPAILQLLQGTIWVHWRRMPGMQPGHSRRSAEAFYTIVEQLNDWWKERILRLDRLNNGFSPESYFAARQPIFTERPAIAEPVAKPATPSYRSYAEAVEQGGDDQIPHRELYRRLRKLTDAIVLRDSMPSYMVANASMIRDMCQWLPQTADELLYIKGFGKRKVEMYGDEFVEEIVAYCEEQGIHPSRTEMPFPEKRKRREVMDAGPKIPTVKMTPTVDVTLNGWKQGKSREEIARERNLTLGTIEGHLSTAIEQGKIEVGELLSAEKIEKIQALLPDEMVGVSLTPIKEQLGEEVTYGEIRMVLAQKKYDAASKVKA